LLCLWLDRETSIRSITAILETFFLRRRNARIFSDWVLCPDLGYSYAEVN
jgi:hypothetical protein